MRLFDFIFIFDVQNVCVYDASQPCNHFCFTPASRINHFAFVRRRLASAASAPTPDGAAPQRGRHGPGPGAGGGGRGAGPGAASREPRARWERGGSGDGGGGRAAAGGGRVPLGAGGLGRAAGAVPRSHRHPQRRHPAQARQDALRPAAGVQRGDPLPLRGHADQQELRGAAGGARHLRAGGRRRRRLKNHSGRTEGRKPL